MAIKYADRVKETTEVTGTASAVLLGAAVGYRSFDSQMTNGEECYYSIVDGTTSQWEIGRGTYISSNILARTEVLSSSNANNAVSFGTGIKDVFITYPSSAINTNAPITNPTFLTGLKTPQLQFSNTPTMDGDAFYETNLNYYAEGYFQRLLGGGIQGASPTVLFTYIRIGNQVTLSINGVNAISTSTASPTITLPLPSHLRPTSAQNICTSVLDNGVPVLGEIGILISGHLSANIKSPTGLFTASGLKGFLTTTVTYLLN